MVGREPQQAVTLGEYTIPAGRTLLISPYVVHRDPRWFPDPERFDPDRFAPGREESIPRYGYIPFGGGPRICIGNSFAIMEAQLVLATLAQRISLRLDPSQVVEMEPLITLRPRYGMHMQVAVREPEPVPA